MPEKSSQQFPSVAFLWPALAAEATSEFASALAHEFAALAVGPPTGSDAIEPQWTTPHTVALEFASVRLRDFSTAPDGVPTLICAPYALHGATVVDFAPGHSLVAALRAAGLRRLFVTDWRSAAPDMRFLSIDSYLADLNVLVDELGGEVDLVGLCQGGWLALIYAARFPAKVRKLVLAGAPIDNAAAGSGLSELARNTPMSLFQELVDIGNGRMLGQHILKFWAPYAFDRQGIHRLLQPADALDSPAFRQLENSFRDWNAWTLDLPGTYYLQVVEQLFKENRLATGRFAALGRQIDLAEVRCTLFLLAARDDELVAPAQIFATERLVGSAPGNIRQLTAPGGHLGLFMGRGNLSELWPEIARWLAGDDRARNAA
ncbi:MAG: poly(3-hydroxyalkanoate) synthetase [Proteobacteria bacterium]|nr:MAG: poly(3-hydroxyalkanoate) synthetase [Pseudomonadota bacterium]